MVELVLVAYWLPYWFIIPVLDWTPQRDFTLCKIQIQPLAVGV